MMRAQMAFISKRELLNTTISLTSKMPRKISKYQHLILALILKDCKTISLTLREMIRWLTISIWVRIITMRMTKRNSRLSLAELGVSMATVTFHRATWTTICLAQTASATSNYLKAAIRIMKLWVTQTIFSNSLRDNRSLPCLMKFLELWIQVKILRCKTQSTTPCLPIHLKLTHSWWKSMTRLSQPRGL